MPSFWPFKTRTTAETYERALRDSHTKIQAAESRLLGLRASYRRVRVLVTLYGSFVYLAYVVYVVLARSRGGARLTAPWLAALVAAPVGIFAVRRLVCVVYERLIAGVDERLGRLRRDQKIKIEEMKEKSGYYSTRALLERFDDSNGPKDKESPKVQRRSSRLQQQQQQQQQRGPPDAALAALVPPLDPAGRPVYTPSHAPVVVHDGPPRWYDRLLDALVGEDETSPKNRYALICSNCRAHNGLAPPGCTDPGEVRYMCPVCGQWNPADKDADELGKSDGDGEQEAADTDAEPDAEPDADADADAVGVASDADAESPEPVSVDADPAGPTDSVRRRTRRPAEE
ncbi:uncharacterized protein V1510DRAFT_411256 [Dipodascopsis tothii]|uniref:uncharacterized protein n=1 Tax=Dipodascopsis tothii TaxID=44089 RepID=UPI0034CDE83B